MASRVGLKAGRPVIYECHRLHHTVSAHKESGVMKREHFLEEDHSIRISFSEEGSKGLGVASCEVLDYLITFGSTIT